ncbi:MAG: sensor histidine kinase [Solirubrobacteraceae bacterium]
MQLLKRLGLDALYLVTGLPVAIAAFTIATAGFSTALGLLVVIVGFPIAALTIVALRAIAMVERRRAALVLGEPIDSAYKQPRSDSLRDRAAALFTDSATWLDTAYALILFPVATIGFSLAVAAWSAALGLLTSPLWYWAIPYHAGIRHVGPFPTDTFARSLLAMLLGVVAVPIAAVLCRGAAAGTGALAAALLGPGRRQLEARVETLQTTRAEAVDVAATELQRIERDLHDGAQARLVAMALDLGMAEDRFERDPEGARELLAKARGDAREALAELRDLARGIRPALLAERGLGDALEALAARTPLPTTVAVVLDERPPPAVEAAIYFTVTEALTNAVKHSGARHARVHVWHDDGRVRAEVRDDGRGGADATGNGLDGLRRRLAVLDGTHSVDSPAGGPTTVRAEVPCAS